MVDTERIRVRAAVDGGPAGNAGTVGGGEGVPRGGSDPRWGKGPAPSGSKSTRAGGKGVAPARSGRPSMPLDRFARGRGRRRGRGGPAGLDPASAGMWLGLGVLLLVLVVVAVSAKSPRSQPPATGSLASLTRPIDGIACSSVKTAAYRAYVHLDLYLRGRHVGVPADIGVFPARGSQPACQYALRTRDTSGVVHVAAPRRSAYTLGQFFDIWGMPLAPGVLMGFQATPGAHGQSVRAYVNGKAFGGNPRQIPLAPNAAITLEYGPPWVAPVASYHFPHGE